MIPKAPTKAPKTHWEPKSFELNSSPIHSPDWNRNTETCQFFSKNNGKSHFKLQTGGKVTKTAAERFKVSKSFPIIEGFGMKFYKQNQLSRWILGRAISEHLGFSTNIVCSRFSIYFTSEKRQFKLVSRKLFRSLALNIRL